MSAKTLRFWTQPRQRETRRSKAATRVCGVEQIGITRLLHTSSSQGKTKSCFRDTQCLYGAVISALCIIYCERWFTCCCLVFNHSSHRLWRWLPLRLSKRQSLSPKVLFRTTLTRTIILDKLFICLFVSLFVCPFSQSVSHSNSHTHSSGLSKVAEYKWKSPPTSRSQPATLLNCYNEP